MKNSDRMAAIRLQCLAIAKKPIGEVTEEEWNLRAEFRFIGDYRYKDNDYEPWEWKTQKLREDFLRKVCNSHERTRIWLLCKEN